MQAYKLLKDSKPRGSPRPVSTDKKDPVNLERITTGLRNSLPTSSLRLPAAGSMQGSMDNSILESTNPLEESSLSYKDHILSKFTRKVGVI
jgi:hypothetical protein